jgi:hypothetical protein
MILDRWFSLRSFPDLLGPDESMFIAERDSFYMPYVQHRGGPKGFLKVIDDRTIAFAGFSGNKQFVSTGNASDEAARGGA